MMSTTDPASLPLRDIHLPDPVSWWPLAPGWWLLCFIIIASILLVLFFIKRSREKRLSAIVLASEELEQIKSNYIKNKNKTELISELSTLLRRVSISIHQRDEIASLTNEDWLAFLDRYTTNNGFTQGVGRILVEAPYQASPEYDSDALLDLIASWFDNVKGERGQPA